MLLRSGTRKGGEEPQGTPTDAPSEDIPEQIEVTTPQGITTPVRTAPSQTPEVYVAGTYAASLPRSPSEPANFRPAQFSFIPQPDYRTAREPSEEGEIAEAETGKQPAANEQTSNRANRRTLNFEAPMRPLDVARDMYLDYTSPQSIKFYSKGCEKLPGEPFNGKMLLTWLVQIQDKATVYTWTSILTIKGKLLTQQFTQITMEEVRAHAQRYQDRASREAQNSEMLIQCLKASITRTVYNKIYLQMDKYIIHRKNTFQPVEDGVCFLKAIIDTYHSSTRSSTKQIRKQLAQLNYYMRNVAKGDVSRLCEHTRELMYELNAAGETTNDLLANLIEALREAPDNNFQRWLSNQVDLWSMRKLDWKEDGSDLMEEAEIYYQEALNTHRWGKRTHRQEVQYAFKAISSETENEAETEVKEKLTINSYEEIIKALTAQLQEQITANVTRWSGTGSNQNMEKKYAWKRTPPKSGEPSTKKVYSDGKTKVYHWCTYHSQWTVHSPAECKRLKSGRKKEYKDRKAFKKQDFKDKKQAYIQAKAAYQACMNKHSSSEDSDSDDEDSNKSFTSYSSEGSNES
jgi:hypothetical protein